MKYTQKNGLRLPEKGDRYTVEDFNYNMEIIDKKLGSGGITAGCMTPAIPGTLTTGTAGEIKEEN